MKHYSTNLKVPLTRKGAASARKVSNLALEFQRTTGLTLASRDAQISLFGREIGNPESTEIQFLMLIFLKARFADSVQAGNIPKQKQEDLIRKSNSLVQKVLSKYYCLQKHNLLIKMRMGRGMVIALLFLLMIGTVILFAVHIRTRIDALCATTTTPVSEIILIAAIGLAMLLSTSLFGYEALKPKDFRDYGKIEYSKEQMLDKLSPDLMRNTELLCTFSVFMTGLMFYLLFGTINGAKVLQSKVELALAITIAALNILSLVIMVASHCDLAVSCSSPETKINGTKISPLLSSEKIFSK